MARYIDTSGAKHFYDGFGDKLDSQSFYEDAAHNILITHAAFEKARRVMEFGCGTGRLADRLLHDVLPDEATYCGCDISETMVSLARARVAAFEARATIWQCGETIDFSKGAPFDRLISTFVLELFPPERIDAVLAESHRALRPDGLLCITNLTHGTSVTQKIVSQTWEEIANIRPSILGGCHPIAFAPRLSHKDWALAHNSIVGRWGIPMEITIAKRI